MILCTVPPHILSGPNAVRYSLVFRVHDQRRRRHTTSNKYIKVSSPSLRKLCLSCITTRNHYHHHHKRQQSNTRKISKTNQRQSFTATTAAAAISSECHIIDSSYRFGVVPRTHQSIPTTLALYSSEYVQENDANYVRDQHPNFETSFLNKKTEKKDDEISPEARTTLAEGVVPETTLLKLASPANEITRSNEDNVVGTC